tara:strand:- start:7669 stop:8181 length:513 start_codon:yes stop_codon:yes gene_type:complete
MKILDWKILLSYLLVLACGILIGFDITGTARTYSNIPAWLSASATLAAVIVALYSNRLNIERDTYKLKCKAVVEYQPIPGRNLVMSVSVNVVNIGLRPISLDNISWVNFEGNTVKIPFVGNDPIQAGCRLSAKFPGASLGLIADIVKFRNTFVVTDVVGIEHRVEFSDTV